ncbi:hypothetical protein [Actinoallomurus rhizosphaericola]|uniref:hypothetical protein n=1 Tax=Actinoallomurus rhizosphaericola TaxID=2952536 RepID=UPI002092F896|nr:hypothetical protein [Actinoallomurus rhizosphaericola]MCO5996730.1 hypothetical protein [Actinoallomurus rhizosphaericola]
MQYTGYTVLEIEQADAVLTVTMKHPRLNLLDSTLIPELKRFVREAAEDPSVTVIVFDLAVVDREGHVFFGDLDCHRGSSPAREGSHGSQSREPTCSGSLRLAATPPDVIAGERCPAWLPVDQREDRPTESGSHRRGHWFEPSIAHPV